VRFYAPGTILFIMARREQNWRVFSGLELGLFIIAVVLAVLGIVGLGTGLITI
jgi:arginine:ornithine antiporter/lysine permease